LPGFPCKSPNHSKKVFGPLPDYGEARALERLDLLARQIEQVFPYGVEILIVSDGRLFADVIGVSDDAVTAYGAEVKTLITSNRVTFLSLEDILGQGSPDCLRKTIDQKYSEDLSRLKERCLHEPDALRLYLGFTKFLSLDLEKRHLESRTAFERRCKQLALVVMQRSDAFSCLIKETFPEYLRLSIHPHQSSVEKLGVWLISNDDGAGTPWHNVVVREASNHERLVHKADIDPLRYRLVVKNGRPWCFESEEMHESECSLKWQ